MKAEDPMYRPTAAGPDRERGQVLVLFTLSLVAMVAMVGLVLDGGSAFAQRRTEQNAADLAAMAGANAYLNLDSTIAARTAAATAAAAAAATQNGYTEGAGQTTVEVDIRHLSCGAEVRVGISSQHANNFARIIPGQESWGVSVTAAAIAGCIDTAVGAAPWTMHIDAFDPVTHAPIYDEDNPAAFGQTNGDYPVGPLDIAWTDYNGSNNVNTSEVRGIIDGSNVVTATIQFDQYIGQHNQGNHTALYGDVQDHLAGLNVPIPITGPCPAPNQSNQGCFKGWATFHVISAQGGSAKDITGYFTGDFRSKPLTVGECTAQQQANGQCGVVEIDTLGLIVRLTE
jgi:Flp pilus assembly protein TadG